MRALTDETERRRVSGCKNHYKIVCSAGAKVENPSTGGDKIPPWRDKNCDNLSRFFIKKAGNNLALLSVLAADRF
jgi:hypothetical protein